MFYRSKVTEVNGQVYLQLRYDVIFNSRDEKIAVKTIEAAHQLLEEDKYLVLQCFFEKVISNFRILASQIPGHYTLNGRKESINQLLQIIKKYNDPGRTSTDLVSDIRDAEHDLQNVLPPEDNEHYQFLKGINSQLILFAKLN